MNKMAMRPPAPVLNTLVHGYWSLTEISTDEGWLEEPLAQWVDTVEILMNDPKLLIEANIDRFLIICNRTGLIIHETMSLDNDAWGEMPNDEAEQMPADYWHGEMKAEAEAERQADAAYELAAELAYGDWEGWD